MGKSILLIGIGCALLALTSPITIFAAEKTSTMMCDEGVVKIGTTNAEVREKWGEPQQVKTPEPQEPVKWVYVLGSTYYVSIVNGKVERIKVGD
jgi:hypothetical protein